MIYYHFNIPMEGPFRWADTHTYIYIPSNNDLQDITTIPLFTSKCQHGQYRTLKVEYCP